MPKEKLDRIDQMAKELGFKPASSSEQGSLPPYVRGDVTVRVYVHTGNGYHFAVDGKLVNGKTPEEEPRIELGGHIFVGHKDYGFLDSMTLSQGFDELQKQIMSGMSGGYMSFMERRKAREKS